MTDIRFVVVDATGCIVNCVMAPPGYTDPQGATVYANTSAEIGWATPDRGSTWVAPLPTTNQLLSYANSKQNKILAQVWSFSIGTPSAPFIATTMLDMIGQHNMAQLALWASWNQLTGATEQYCNVDYSFLTLSSNQVQLLAIKSRSVVSATYATLNSCIAAIQAKRITTTAQIDAANWPDASLTR